MTPPLHTPHTPPSQRANGDGGSAHTKAKGTTSLDTSIVAAASKSKNKMIAAEVAAKNLLAYVQQDPKWSWCCAGNLVKLQNEVEKNETLKTPFAQQRLSCEVANTKKAFTTEELVMNFMEFTKRSDEVSAALAWETQRLVRMHYAQIV